MRDGHGDGYAVPAVCDMVCDPRYELVPDSSTARHVRPYFIPATRTAS
eukprot:SAG31_NODE_1576_length_7838_cov_5.738468_12_plen_48_part_00